LFPLAACGVVFTCVEIESERKKEQFVALFTDCVVHKQFQILFGELVTSRGFSLYRTNILSCLLHLDYEGTLTDLNSLL
jgi:hypothetical protein